MPVTSTLNIQAKPSMRRVKFKPNAGSHSTLQRIASPAAICG